jgi:hypothetical protein
VNVSASIVGSDGTVIDTTEPWSTPVRHFGLSNTGRWFWYWSTTMPDALPEGARLELRIDAEVAQPEPADVMVDLTGIEVQ